MPTSRRSVGFITSLSHMTLGSLLWPEGVLSAVIGLGGGGGILYLTRLSERISLVGSAFTVLGVLLGVVFAAFALLIALLSDEYIQILGHANDGVIAFFRPFIVAVGLQVTTIFVGLGYGAAAPHIPAGYEGAAFLIWAFLFSYVLIDVVALTRMITMHGMARARQVALKDNPVASHGRCK